MATANPANHRYTNRGKVKTMLKQLRNAIVALALVAAASTAHASPLSAARPGGSSNPGAIKRYLMKASTTIYAGGLVMLDSNGKALPAAAAAGNQGVVGVATETVTSGSSGNYYIKCQEGWFKLDGTTLSQTDVGYLVYAEDDHTVDETRAATEPVAGMLLEVVDASTAWVYVAPLFATMNDTGLVSGLNLGTWSNSTDGAWTLTEASEDLIITFTSNTVTLSSSTGVSTLNLGALTLTLENGAVISNASNNSIKLAENSEDLSIDFSSNAVALTSSTGVTSLDFGAVLPKVTVANDIGWTVANGANTACNTTCATSGCVFGMNTGALGNFVACTDATADTCICAGP